jgi:general stress protein 26
MGRPPDFPAGAAGLRSQMNTTARDPQAFNRLGELIKDINIAMVTTVGVDGALHSRPMFTRRLENDENLWFFTSDDSGKAREIAQEHQVGVTYSEPKQQHYVSVAGTGILVRERALMS